MKRSSLSLIAAAVLALAANAAHADGAYRNPDNKNPHDPAEGTYPIPYRMPTWCACATTWTASRRPAS